jgi:hypothetical protein
LAGFSSLAVLLTSAPGRCQQSSIGIEPPNRLVSGSANESQPSAGGPIDLLFGLDGNNYPATLLNLSHATLQTSFDDYRDSDRNQVFTLSSQADWSTDGFMFAFQRHTVETNDDDGKEALQANALSIYRDWSGDWGLGGGIGTVGTADGWSTFIGSLRTSATVLGVSLDLAAERELVAGDTETIRSRVRETGLEFDASRSITEKLSAALTVHHRFFSDGNSSNEVRVSPKYMLDIGRTKLSLGYSFQYIDYANPSNNEHRAYYAPNGLLANHGTANWRFRWHQFYGALEFDLGRFMHLATPNTPSEFAGSGMVALGHQIFHGGYVEAYLTGGRDALGTPRGWRSMNSGMRLSWGF